MRGPMACPMVLALGLLSATACFASPAQAQQSNRPREIGALMAGSETDARWRANAAAFEDALRKLGWTDGNQLHIEYRWAGATADRVTAQAAELVRLTPSVIVASTSVTLAALEKATHTIPIVFTVVADPVAQGLVSNLPHPGGNVTGFVAFEFEVGGKWLGILRELAPQLAHVLFLYDPETSPQSSLFERSIESAAQPPGIPVTATPVREADEIAPAIDEFARTPNGGLIIAQDAFLSAPTNRKLVLDAVARNRLPAIYGLPSFTDSGGLVSFSLDIVENWRNAATYVDRILKGADPGDLPIQEPTKYILVVNRKTAKAQGFELPFSLIARADEVIE